MRKNLVAVALLILYGCGGGGGTTGGSTSSTGGLPSNGGGNPPNNPPGPGNTPLRVLELINRSLISAKEVVRPLVDELPNDAYDPQISPDGRLVSFLSAASDLVEGDTNGALDLFVRDRQTGVTVRVNYDPDDPRTHNGAGQYFFSEDLRWVVFNIPTQPPSALGSRFLLRNVETGQTFEGRGFLGGLSPDGRYVSYWQGPNPTHPYLFDRETQQITDLTPTSNGDSIAWQFSPDGTLVYFSSEASNLVPNDNNGVGDVFTYRLSDGHIELVSVKADGTQFNGKSIPGESSGDGRYYTFPSEASNVVDGDNNGVRDIFVKDNQTGEFTLVSRALSGAANGDSQTPSISGDGRLIVFNSKASNLVEKDTNEISDAFLYNRETQTLLGRVSLNYQNKEAVGGDDRFRTTKISRDGNWITFTNEATNMMPGVFGGHCNVFLTNSVVPELFQPPGPHPNAFELLFTGNANLDMSPFNVSSPRFVDGRLEPQASDAQRLWVRAGVGFPISRELTISFNKGASQLAVGDQIELPDPNGNEVFFGQFELTPDFNGPSLLYRNGNEGTMTITSLVPGQGTAGTVGVRFDNWEMIPVAQGGNAATGSFRINGTVTLTLPGPP